MRRLGLRVLVGWSKWAAWRGAAAQLAVGQTGLRTLLTRGPSAKRGCRLGSATRCRHSYMVKEKV